MQKQRAIPPSESEQGKVINETAWVSNLGHFRILNEARSDIVHPVTQVLPSAAPSTLPIQQFYTVKEAAAILKISEDTLRRVMRRGQIAYVGISPRTRRISQKTLDRFAEQEAGIQHETSWQ